MHRAYIETMGMKNVHKVLKVALWMYMIDFLHKPIILGGGNKVSRHIDRIANVNDMRAGIEVSREAYLNFLQIYVSANVMLVGL